MVLTNFNYKILIAVSLLHLAHSMSPQSNNKVKSYFMDTSSPEKDVADFIESKGEIPNEKYLPKTSVVQGADNDVRYILSKLSDEELIKLLNNQPKKTEYDINDIVKLPLDSKYFSERDNKIKIDKDENVNTGNESQKNRLNTELGKEKLQVAFLRLENKSVDPYSMKTKSDSNYKAIKKLSNMLYSRPVDLNKDDQSTEEEVNKELLFNVLVAQLKTLCCKKSKSKSKDHKINDFLPLNPIQSLQTNDKLMTNEHMFLIMNDEISSNGSEEVISVDPDSLEKNSSVLLLGPITTPLTDSQLKLVMSRITNELSQEEYLPLLHQLSDGTLSGSNIKLMKNLITGPDMRRYIKPYRCNHQSKLAKVYGGPKWIICTGYLNINTPSVYD